MIEQTVELAPPSVKFTFPVESDPHTTQVLLVSSVLNELEVNTLVPEVHESSSHVPIKQEANSHVPTKPPLSSLVTSFDWSRLAGYHLPSYVPFQIIVQAYHMVIPSIVINEGASINILSSTAWQALCSPQLVPVTQNLLAFNKGTSQPLGILPKCYTVICHRLSLSLLPLSRTLEDSFRDL